MEMIKRCFDTSFEWCILFYLFTFLSFLNDIVYENMVMVLERSLLFATIIVIGLKICLSFLLLLKLYQSWTHYNDSSHRVYFVLMLFSRLLAYWIVTDR